MNERKELLVNSLSCVEEHIITFKALELLASLWLQSKMPTGACEFNSWKYNPYVLLCVWLQKYCIGHLPHSTLRHTTCIHTAQSQSSCGWAQACGRVNSTPHWRRLPSDSHTGLTETPGSGHRWRHTATVITLTWMNCKHLRRIDIQVVFNTCVQMTDLSCVLMRKWCLHNLTLNDHFTKIYLCELQSDYTMKIKALEKQFLELYIYWKIMENSSKYWPVTKYFTFDFVNE